MIEPLTAREIKTNRQITISPGLSGASKTAAQATAVESAPAWRPNEIVQESLSRFETGLRGLSA